MVIDSLASSVKTNSSTVVLGKTKAATKVDCELILNTCCFRTYLTGYCYQIVKYTLLYIVVVAFLAALIALRTFFSHFILF